MINKLILPLLICGLLAALPHDYHIGIHEIELNPDKNTFEITHKLFVDDLESALRLRGFQHSIGDNPEEEQSLKAIKEYLESHFTLSVNNNKTPIQTLGAKWEDYHTLLIFRESNKVGEIKALEISNDMFLEIADDQQHMHHVTIGSEKFSLPLMKGKERASIKL